MYFLNQMHDHVYTVFFFFNSVAEDTYRYMYLAHVNTSVDQNVLYFPFRSTESLRWPIAMGWGPAALCVVRR